MLSEAAFAARGLQRMLTEANANMLASASVKIRCMRIAANANMLPSAAAIAVNT